MIVVVNDANILIDLIKLDLLRHFFALNFALHTTDAIVEELNVEQQQILAPFSNEGELTVNTFTADETSEIGALASTLPQLSFADCSAFICVQREKGRLLTSDNALRRAAERAGLDVSGHLWLFDQMVDQGTLDTRVAAQKLTELRAMNTRLGLPETECEQRLECWSQK